VTCPESEAPPSSSALTGKLAGADAHVAQFSGSLDDLSVADLIQILQLAGKSAAVMVSNEQGESRLWCLAGEIVDAESGRLRGEAAVHRMLGFERGWMQADLRSPARTRSIFAGTQRLLLESARRKDESVALRQKLGDGQRCYRLAPGLNTQQLSLGALELCLLRSFAEARSLSEVLEASELGDFETLNALLTWVEAGHLVEAGVRPCVAPPTPPPLPAAAPDGLGTLRPLVASASPAPPGRAVRRGLFFQSWGVIAALLLTPAGYLLGSQTRPLEPAAGSLLAVATSATVLDDTPSIPLALRVEPPEAEIWLDGEQAGVGELEMLLPRNGVAHQLRVDAPGFLPLRILFVDTPPPPELALEPLPAREPAAAPGDDAAGVDGAAPSPASAAAGDPVKARKRPAPARAPSRRDPQRPNPRARPHAAAGALREASARPGALSNASEPIVRVLD
jgi:hypothetical protein